MKITKVIILALISLYSITMKASNSDVAPDHRLQIISMLTQFGKPAVSPLITNDTDTPQDWTTIPLTGLKSSERYDIYNAACSKTFCVAAGARNEIVDAAKLTDISYPLLFIRGLNDADWQMIAELSIDNKEGEFRTVTCTDTTCIAGGEIASTNKTTTKIPKTPFMLYSSDGKTWQQVQLNPAEIQPGSIDKIACNSKQCFAFGRKVFKDKKVELPLILVSDTNKPELFVEDSLTIPAQTADSIDFYSIPSCSDYLCIAIETVQRYMNSSTQTQDMLLQSRNYGKHWERAPIVNRNGSELYAQSCGSQACVVAGATKQTQAEDAVKQFLLINKPLMFDDWKIVQVADLPSVKINSSVIHDVSCDKDSCAAVGMYTVEQSGQIQTLPLLLISHDGGAMWHWNGIAARPALNTDTLSLKSVSCSNRHCSAVGSYTIQGAPQVYPWILYGEGDAWTIRTPQTLDPQMQNVELNEVKCQNKLCIATGISRDPAYLGPRIANSTDGGQHWSWLNIPSVTDTDSAIFSSITFSQ